MEIRDIDTAVPERISPIAALCRLADVDDAAAIGDHGPVIASRAARSDAAKELRLFEVLFGRDSLICALLVAEPYPKLLHATVTRLAALQGIIDRPAAEEQPGRIVHEARDPSDPIAQRITRSGGWEWPYYGSVDATPLFVIACRLLEHSKPGALAEVVVGRDAVPITLAQSCARALGWLGRRIEQSPSHFVETRPTLAGGLANQSWKDSWDAYSHPDGRVAKAPLSSAEVQGFAYDALAFAPELAGAYPDALSSAEVEALETLRSNLRSSFRALYVLDGDGPPIAAGVDYATDGTPTPLRVGESNMGHLLSGSLFDDLEVDGLAERVTEYLLSSVMLAGAGVRTLAADAARYRDGAYHNGSVWLWENAGFALGLHRRGLDAEARDLSRRIVSACHTFGAFPEFARGGDEIAFNTRIVDIEDARGRRNRIEQPPQQIQAWTVAGVIALEAAGLTHEDVGQPL